MFAYLLLDTAGTVLAVGTLKGFIGSFPEPFGVFCIYYLPTDQNHKRSKEKAPAVEASYEKHGSEHHEVPPDEDPAADAAFTLYHKCLKRAKEQYAYVIPDEIKKCDHHQFGFADHMREEQRRDDGI